MNKASALSRQAPRQAHGLTLVELLVAMVVGLAVIGAALSMYVGSGNSSRSSGQVAQMSEDASAALSILRTHIAMAGYSRPIGTSAAGFTKVYQGQAIFGCQNGLDANSQGKLLSTEGALTCNTGNPSAADTLIVLYEADINNTIPGSNSLPTDCLGNELAQRTVDVGGTPHNFFLSEDRFYVNSSGTLLCKGNGGSTANTNNNTPAQPLVENIADFSVSYGLASSTDIPTGGSARPGTVAHRYVSAGTVGLIDDANWNRVVSVRLCVVVRSEEDALDNLAAPYTDCHGNTVTPSTWPSSTKVDRRSYRKFISTVVLNNRIQQGLE